MTQFHRQCALKLGKGTKKNPAKQQVSWIPEEHAVVGKILRLKNQVTGNWEDGWIVVSVGSRMESKAVQERTQDYKNMRKMTDI